MAGLGIGSHLGGRLSTRLRTVSAFAAFAVIELSIAAFGAASTFLYYDWLYPHAVHLPSLSLRAALLHLAALLPPTVLMGMSLPLLARAVRERRRGRRPPHRLALRHQHAGGRAGAFAAPWLLLPRFGVRGAVQAAALANLLVGAGALVLAAVRRLSERPPAESPLRAAPPTGAELPGSRPLRLWLLLYTLSGFVASRWRSFGSAASRWRSSPRPSPSAPCSPSICWARPRARCSARRSSPGFAGRSARSCSPVRHPGGGRDPRDPRRRAAAGHAAPRLVRRVLGGLRILPARTRLGPHEHRAPLRAAAARPVLPSDGADGRLVPVLQRAVQDDPATSGRKVGTLQAANIPGCYPSRGSRAR